MESVHETTLRDALYDSLNEKNLTDRLFSGFALYPLEHSKPNMYKSGVVDADNGGSSFSNIRTSTGSFLPIGKTVRVFWTLFFQTHLLINISLETAVDRRKMRGVLSSNYTRWYE